MQTDNKLEIMGDFFNKRADTYDEHMQEALSEGFEDYYMTLSEPMEATKKEIKILELGCGTGIELEGIFEKCPNAFITGIDLSEGMLDILRNKYSQYSNQIDVIVDSYMTYPYEQMEYDYVLASMTMHHFLEDEKINIYKKIYEALEDGGVYIEGDYMVDQQEEQECLDYYFKRKKESDELCHIDIPFTVEHQKELLKRAGFTNITVIWKKENAAILVACK